MSIDKLLGITLLPLIIIIVVIVIIIVLIAIIKSSKKTRNSNMYYPNQNSTKSYRNEEFLRVFSSIDNMNEDELEEMHRVLLEYSLKIPKLNSFLPPDAPRQDPNVVRRQRIENGPIYGCITYGEAEQLNQAIVKKLDSFYD